MSFSSSNSASFISSLLIGSRGQRYFQSVLRSYQVDNETEFYSCSSCTYISANQSSSTGSSVLKTISTYLSFKTSLPKSRSWIKSFSIFSTNCTDTSFTSFNKFVLSSNFLSFDQLAK